MGDFVDLFRQAGYRGTGALPGVPSTAQELKLDGHIKDIRGALPDQSTLPQHIKDFLAHVKTLPVLERATHIHKFVIDNMQYDEAKSRQDIVTGNVSMNYADVLRNYKKGDCDNHATLEIALLRYSGVKPQDISWISGQFKYDEDGKEIQNAKHNAAILKVDGAYYLLDMNFEKPVPLGGKLTAKGEMAKENVGSVVATLLGDGVADYFETRHLAMDVKIKPSLLIPLSPDQDVLVYQDAGAGLGASPGLSRGFIKGMHPVNIGKP